MHAIQVGNRFVELVHTPIEELPEHFDALVSSDDNYLSHGGGVSRALWTKAGTEVLEAYVDANRPALALGDVFVTDAFGLNAAVLFHAVTIDFDANRRLDPREARELYGTVLDAASKRNLRSLATPLLGSGAGRLGPEASARALAEAVNERASVESTLRRIVLVALEADFRRAQRALEDHLRPRPPLERLLSLAAARAGKTGAALLRATARTAQAEATGDPAAPVLLFDATLSLFLELLVKGASADRLEGRTTIPLQRGSRSRLALAPEAKEGLSPAAKVRLVSDLARAWEVPPPGSLVHACAEAGEARTQLVSPFPGADPAPLQRKVLRAVESMLEWIVYSSPGAPPPAEAERLADVRELNEGTTAVSFGYFGRIAGRLGARAEPSRGREAGRPASSVRTARRSRAAAPPLGATTHVRRLRDFLLDALEREVLVELVDELRAEKGHKGDDDAILLEHCASMPDPVDFVVSHFTARDLRKALEARTSCRVRTGASSNVLARTLLESFGYPACAELKGLRTVLRRLRQLRRDVTTASRTELGGAVTEAASDLEHLLHLHLRFLCQAVFLESPEVYLARSAKMPFAKRGLGTLIQHLGDVYREIAETDSPRAAPFRRAVEEPLPKATLQLLPELRNEFAHVGRGNEELTVTQAREKALAFFDAAITFVERLAREDEREKRIFPHVLRIESIRVDRWGRRTVTAVSDEEEPGENLFTDDPLRPGELYLMHPLTNPLRVDPILVPAGETEEEGA